MSITLGKIAMTERNDPVVVRSFSGTIAAFFLLQCFGFVALQGFRMFLHVGIRGSGDPSVSDLLAAIVGHFFILWGLCWIVAFVVFQAHILRRILDFVRNKEILLGGQSLKSPMEALNWCFAALFGFLYWRFLLGHYAFPSRPISILPSVLFGVFGLAASSLWAWAMERSGNRHGKYNTRGELGSAMMFLVGTIFLAVGYFLGPRTFYFHGMVGLSMMTLGACQSLLRGTVRRRLPNQRSEPQHVRPKLRRIRSGCMPTLIITAAVLCAGYWFAFNAESPLNRKSSFATLYRWTKLSPIPDSARNVSIVKSGSIFTRGYTVEFDAPEKDVSLWLLNSPGTQDVTPEVTAEGWAEYKIDPGGGANYAEVFVSPEGTHVRVYACWS